jgi:tetratricopeptide (TPR) repeat protein
MCLPRLKLHDQLLPVALPSLVNRLTSLLLALCLIPWAASAQTPQQIAEDAAAAQARGDYATAANDYRKLVESGNDSPELRSNLGIMLYQLQEYGEALAQFQEAARQKPSLTAINLFSGLCLLHLQRVPEALRQLKKAQLEQPEAPGPVLALARAYVAARQTANARDAYQRATQIQPSNSEAWYGLGITSRALAEQQLNRATKGGTATQGAETSTLGKEARRNLELADEALARAAQLDPENLKAHILLGESFRESGQKDKSVAEYQQILKTNPHFLPAYLGLATTYWKFAQVDEAMRVTEEALKYSPDDAEANAMMANFFTLQNKMQEAEPLARHALQKQPHLSLAQVALAKVYLFRGQTQEALRLLQQATPEDTDGSWNYILAQTLRKMGRHQEAEQALRRSEELRRTVP